MTTLAKTIASAPQHVKATALSRDSRAAGESLKAWGESLNPDDGPEHAPERRQKRAAIEHGERLIAGAPIGRRALKSAGLREA